MASFRVTYIRLNKVYTKVDIEARSACVNGSILIDGLIEELTTEAESMPFGEVRNTKWRIVADRK